MPRIAPTKYAGRDGVEDQRTRRRNQDSGGGRADVDRRGVVGIVTLIRFQGGEDRAHGGGSGNRGAGHRAEEHVGKDVGSGQVAGNPAHQESCQAHQALGNAALVHDVAAQGEEGQRQQREAVKAGEALLGRCEREALEVRAAGGADGNDRGNTDARRDGYTCQQHDKEGDKQNDCSSYDHYLLSPFFSANMLAYFRIRASTISTPQMGSTRYRVFIGICMTEDTFVAVAESFQPP